VILKIYDVLYEGMRLLLEFYARSFSTGKGAQQAVQELMELPPSKELELPEQKVGGPADNLLRKLGLM
jgi:hypothetical protein